MGHAWHHLGVQKANEVMDELVIAGFLLERYRHPEHSKKSQRDCHSRKTAVRRTVTFVAMNGAVAAGPWVCAGFELPRGLGAVELLQLRRRIKADAAGVEPEPEPGPELCVACTSQQRMPLT
eukprot:SAG11_NODE_2699_length_3077_cov_2.064473_4_plen_122_part_00